MTPDRDPGWTPALKGILLAPVAPFMMMIWQQRGSRIDLVRLRTILVGMLTVDALLLVGLNFIHPFGPVSLEGRDLLYTSLVAASGLYSLLAPWLLRRQKVPTPETPDGYAALYRGRFFVSLGMAMTPGLFGFVCSFIIGRWWVYLVGLAFTFAGLLRLAPTRASLARVDAELRAEGRAFSLYDALGE